MKTGESLLRPRRPFGAAWQNTSLLDGDGNASKICASHEQLGSAAAAAERRPEKELAPFGNDFPHALLPSAQHNIAVPPERLHWRLGR